MWSTIFFILKTESAFLKLTIFKILESYEKLNCTEDYLWAWKIEVILSFRLAQWKSIQLTEIRISVVLRGAIRHLGIRWNRLDDPIHPAGVFHNHQWENKTKGTEERNELQLAHNIWYYFFFIQRKILILISENKLIKCFSKRHSGHYFYWQIFFREFCTASLQRFILKIFNEVFLTMFEEGLHPGQHPGFLLSWMHGLSVAWRWIQYKYFYLSLSWGRYHGMTNNFFEIEKMWNCSKRIYSYLHAYLIASK